MTEPSRVPARSAIGALVLIAIIVGGGAAAFAYTAGWFSPVRLSGTRLVAAFTPPGDKPPLGHRRNHAKGICFTGAFEASGDGEALSYAQVFAHGEYPVVGRFNLGTPDPNAPDSTVRVRGMGLSITSPDGQVWRAAMINAPVFPVSTPQQFYALLMTSGSKDPKAMPDFIAANPEFAPFGAWATKGTWSGSYAEERYNSLDSFVFTNSIGVDHAVRWSLIPAAPVTALPPDELAKRGPDYLEREIVQRVQVAPQRWSMTVTVAASVDPTADPSKAWPEDRRTVTVGTLVVRHIEAEADGPCRDINFDPTILPAGMHTSNDPFPAARSAAYAKSYDLRTAESADYPHAPPEAKP